MTEDVNVTSGLFLVFALAALFVILKEDGGNESLQVHHVLIKVPSVFILPDAPLQVILSRLARGENINAGTMI